MQRLAYLFNFNNDLLFGTYENYFTEIINLNFKKSRHRGRSFLEQNNGVG